ncbi:MAG: pyridoxal phosphate-dependent aminotransferase [Planctomycetes bacterium]|nr:pyridoxal phosphate-dependent aminotransferase [Planctomycetota bacterium]NOG52822.1 pyridoxal phosphate-dependent aminotransferase [Planctomycetota bacterium]
MCISKMASSIRESVTLKLNAKAGELRRSGAPVIHLGGGEPKSKAPASAAAEVTKLVESGEVRYAPADGIAPLKEAIARYTAEYYQRAVKPEHILASGGAKQALYSALQAFLEPGDEVLMPSPYWVSYPEIISMLGGEPKPFVPADGSVYPCLSDIERAAGPRTRAVIINSPNNPSGAMYGEQFIADVVRYCEQHDLYLIMDDIYHRLVFDGKKAPNCYDFASSGPENDSSRLIVVNGVSKQYAMTGYRIGWAVAARPLITVMATLQGHQTSGPSIVGQVAAVGALNGDQSSVDQLRADLEQNRNVLLEQLAGIPGISVTKPDGTFYCFVDFSTHDADSTRLAEWLIEKVQVVTVPGLDFGLEGYLRLSYCGSADDVIQGVARIKWALDPDAPKELTQGGHTWEKDWH